jgi:hypothetical protein
MPGFTTHALAQVLRLGVVVRHSADDFPPGARDVVMLLNANDRTVKLSPSIDLARKWSARGAAARVLVFPESLRLPHNVLDTPERGGKRAIVAPLLAALVHGTSPPDHSTTIDLPLPR